MLRPLKANEAVPAKPVAADVLWTSAGGRSTPSLSGLPRCWRAGNDSTKSPVETLRRGGELGGRLRFWYEEAARCRGPKVARRSITRGGCLSPWTTAGSLSGCRPLKDDITMPAMPNHGRADCLGRPCRPAGRLGPRVIPRQPPWRLRRGRHNPHPSRNVDRAAKKNLVQSPGQNGPTLRNATMRRLKTMIPSRGRTRSTEGS